MEAFGWATVTAVARPTAVFGVKWLHAVMVAVSMSPQARACVATRCRIPSSLSPLPLSVSIVRVLQRVRVTIPTGEVGAIVIRPTWPATTPLTLSASIHVASTADPTLD